METTKPRVGHLVRVSDEYPNTNAAGAVALVVAAVGIECKVEPTSPWTGKHPSPWWFERRWLEVLS
jgi:hypothetical protein